MSTFASFSIPDLRDDQHPYGVRRTNWRGDTIEFMSQWFTSRDAADMFALYLSEGAREGQSLGAVADDINDYVSAIDAELRHSMTAQQLYDGWRETRKGAGR
jgi:hypothetical protein